jgi:quinol monooxygenase YgiN
MTAAPNDPPQPKIVIAAFRPKPGKSRELKSLMKRHLSRLRKDGLVTDRKRIRMEASDGTIIELFEWKSQEAIEKAHATPDLISIWDEYNDVCKHIPISELQEKTALFADFTPYTQDEP